MATVIGDVNFIDALGFAGYVCGVDFSVKSVFQDPENNLNPIGWNSGQHTLDNVDWLHPTDPKPTEQQCIDWQNQFEAQVQAEQQMDDDIDSELIGYTFTKQDALIALKLMSVIANSSGQTIDNIYASFASELNGSTLENPIKEYVETMTGLSSFGLGIPSNEKQQILRVVISYLQAGLLVWIGKRLRGI